MSPILQHLVDKPNSVTIDENLKTLTKMVKVFAADGSGAILAVSGLQTDTDGKRSPLIHNYESTHQDQITYDSHPPTIDSNAIPFAVMPIGFSARHGHQCEMGTLGTIFYNGRHVHVVYADLGPEYKFGEASIAVHRALGIELVHNGHYTDSGIESGVTSLIYLGSHLALPLTADKINQAAEVLYKKFLG